MQLIIEGTLDDDGTEADLAAARVPRMVGADTDVSEAAAELASDPVLGPLVTARPGVRVPGAWGPLEAIVSAVVAQRCEPAAARAAMGPASPPGHSPPGGSRAARSPRRTSSLTMTGARGSGAFGVWQPGKPPVTWGERALGDERG